MRPYQYQDLVPGLSGHVRGGAMAWHEERSLAPGGKLYEVVPNDSVRPIESHPQKKYPFWSDIIQEPKPMGDFLPHHKGMDKFPSWSSGIDDHSPGQAEGRTVGYRFDQSLWGS